MKTPRLVKASSMSATYSAGVYCTDSDAEAIEQARENYRDSSLGRSLKDVGAFRFYVAGRGRDAYERLEG
jgi:hypothetical protein